MQKIENKTNTFANKYKVFAKKMCWKMNDFMKLFREKFFCNYAINIEQIKQDVKEVNRKAEVYNKIEEQLPNIYELIEELKREKKENKLLNSDIDKMIELFRRVYVADMTNDAKTKQEIYDLLFNYKILV